MSPSAAMASPVPGDLSTPNTPYTALLESESVGDLAHFGQHHLSGIKTQPLVHEAIKS